MCRIYLQQHYEHHGCDLRKRICFAKDAGAEIAQPGDGVEHSADEQIISAVVAKFYPAACQLSISGVQEAAVSSSVAPAAFGGNF